MNIGIVTTWFERGAAYVSKQFMNVLMKTDNVFIYARGGEKYAQNDPLWDLENVWWGKKNEILIASYESGYIDKKDFINWITTNKIDAILFNEQRYYKAILWSKELGVKAIAYVDYYTKNTLPLFDVYDCVICNTKRHALAMQNHKNPVYLKWGTNINLYQPTHRNNEKLVFFHSAGMSPYRKGTDLLIKAFYNIRERAKAKLLLHTQVNLINRCPNCKDEIEVLLKEGSLEIIEKTVSAPGLFYLGDIYVYPSRLDGIGLTLMEAVASGMPIITINNAPMNEFIEDSFGSVCDVEEYHYREDGYFWPMSDASVESLANIMKDYINGKHNIEQMKVSAREYALKNLDFEKNMNKLRDVFLNTELLKVSDDLRKMIIKYDLSKFSIKRYIKAIIKQSLCSNRRIRDYLNKRYNH